MYDQCRVPSSSFLRSCRKAAGQAAGCGPPLDSPPLPLLLPADPPPPAPPSPAARCSKWWAGCSLRPPAGGCVSLRRSRPKPGFLLTAGRRHGGQGLEKQKTKSTSKLNVEEELLPNLCEARDGAWRLHVSELTGAVAAPGEHLDGGNTRTTTGLVFCCF